MPPGRSRPLAVLTYSFIRSARSSGCGLAGREFLNTPPIFHVCILVTHGFLNMGYDSNGRCQRETFLDEVQNLH